VAVVLATFRAPGSGSGVGRALDGLEIVVSEGRRRVLDRCHLGERGTLSFLQHVEFSVCLVVTFTVDTPRDYDFNYVNATSFLLFREFFFLRIASYG